MRKIIFECENCHGYVQSIGKIKVEHNIVMMANSEGQERSVRSDSISFEVCSQACALEILAKVTAAIFSSEKSVSKEEEDAAVQ